MPHSNCKILDTGNIFPKLTFRSVEGGLITLPDDSGGGWSILLFYRGHW